MESREERRSESLPAFSKICYPSSSSSSSSASLVTTRDSAPTRMGFEPLPIIKVELLATYGALRLDEAGNEGRGSSFGLSARGL